MKYLSFLSLFLIFTTGFTCSKQAQEQVNQLPKNNSATTTERTLFKAYDKQENVVCYRFEGREGMSCIQLNRGVNQ